MVKIYTTPTCVYCKTLIEYLKKHNINFEVIDVSKDEKQLEAMIKSSGQMGVPVIDIDGQIIVGYDPDSFKKLLGIK